MCIQVNVVGPMKQQKNIFLCDTEEQMNGMTVQHLKKKIVHDMPLSTDDNIRMVFKAEKLEEGALLTTYGIKHMSTIHTLLILDGGL
ncbi:hypothetical protein NQZ68_011921 [Scomber scombrus]|uniref:Ubiquitin-like domain-containing protein n=1 Tax=Scomber scombrus TaxID=13677 RepID=A0AAV1N0P9_SCOSC